MATKPTVSDTNAVIKTHKISNFITWVLTDGESGDPYPVAGFNDKSVHIYGDFEGASVTMKGGNVDDAANFVTLKNFDAAPLTFTGSDLDSIRDHIGFLHPVVTGGVNAAITIVVLVE